MKHNEKVPIYVQYPIPEEGGKGETGGGCEGGGRVGGGVVLFLYLNIFSIKHFLVFFSIKQAF